MNPNKDIIVTVKGTKEEAIRELERMLKYVREYVLVTDRTFKGTIWRYKEEPKDTFIDMKIF